MNISISGLCKGLTVQNVIVEADGQVDLITVYFEDESSLQVVGNFRELRTTSPEWIRDCKIGGSE